MEIFVSRDQLERLGKTLEELTESQIAFATSITMNKGLTAARNAVVQYMDRGGIEGGAHRWTRQGMKAYQTKKRDLSGSLVFKSDREYMQEILHGGTKFARNKRLPEPINAPLTKEGNFRRNWQQRAIEQKNTYLGKSKAGNKTLFRRPRGKKGSPVALVSYERPKRPQRATFKRAPEYAAKAFNSYVRNNFGKMLREAMKKGK
jgi:hypothetical protein